MSIVKFVCRFNTRFSALEHLQLFNIDSIRCYIFIRARVSKSFNLFFVLFPSEFCNWWELLKQCFDQKFGIVASIVLDSGRLYSTVYYLKQIPLSCINNCFLCALSSVQLLSSQKRMLAVFLQSRVTLISKESSVRGISKLFCRSSKQMLLIKWYDFQLILHLCSFIHLFPSSLTSLYIENHFWRWFRNLMLVLKAHIYG